MTVKDKIKEYLDFKGISPTATERKLGWGVGAFTKAKSITSDRCKEFLLAFEDLSADWLMRDKGEMLNKPSTVQDFDRIATLVDTIATLNAVINDKDATIAALNEQIKQLKNK